LSASLFLDVFLFCVEQNYFFSVKKIVMYIIYKNMIIFFLEVNIAELN